MDTHSFVGAGRFSPLGPLGTLNHLLFLAAHWTDTPGTVKAIRSLQRTGGLLSVLPLSEF